MDIDIKKLSNEEKIGQMLIIGMNTPNVLEKVEKLIEEINYIREKCKKTYCYFSDNYDIL